VHKFICLFILCLIVSSKAAASIDKSFFSNDFFTVSKSPKNWERVDVSNKDEIVIALQPPSKNSSFTLREFSSPNPSLKQNVVSWMTDYKAYGFKILSSKPVKLNDKTYGYFIQALHKKSKKVFKQYMSIKNKKLVVLTCHSNSKSNEFSDCAESLTSFSWNTIQ